MKIISVSSYAGNGANNCCLFAILNGCRAQSGYFLSIWESNIWSIDELNTIGAWCQVHSYNAGYTFWISYA